MTTVKVISINNIAVASCGRYMIFSATNMVNVRFNNMYLQYAFFTQDFMFLWFQQNKGE